MDNLQTKVKTKTKTKTIVAVILIGGALAAAAFFSVRIWKAMPDLTVTLISPNPITGLTTVNIQNVGTGAAGAFGLKLEAIDAAGRVIVTGTAKSEGLAAGSVTGLDLLLKRTPTELPSIPVETAMLRATVDFDNRVSESNEGNNILELRIPIPLPDLTVTLISPNPITGLTTVNIQNVGTGAAGAFGLKLEAIDAAGRVIVTGELDILSLAAEQSTQRDIPLIMPGATLSNIPLNTAVLRATVDFRNQVSESNEGNNTMEWRRP